MTRHKMVIFLIIVLSVICLVTRNRNLHYSRNILPGIGVIASREPNVSALNITNDHLVSIRRDCGELCDTSKPGLPGPFFKHVRANTNCEALFRNKYIDRGHGLPHAPRKIPKELLRHFTMNNRLSVISTYYDNKYLGKNASMPVWTTALIENMTLLAKNGLLNGNYGRTETNALRDGIRRAPGVKNGRVMVIGSENPWVEACVLEAGAKQVVTLEYGKIISRHEKVKTLLPYDFRMQYLNKTLQEFNAIVTFSSVEHSGLGRYGDALNPWGDIIAIAKAWCVTKKGGSLTIGVPYNDHLRFNADRGYGKLRYPYLTTNWKQLYRGRGSQRVHVFIRI